MTIDPKYLKPSEKPWDESSEESRDNCRRDGANTPHHAYYDGPQDRAHEPAEGVMVKLRLDRLWAWLGWT